MVTKGKRGRTRKDRRPREKWENNIAEAVGRWGSARILKMEAKKLQNSKESAQYVVHNAALLASFGCELCLKGWVKVSEFAPKNHHDVGEIWEKWPNCKEKRYVTERWSERQEEMRREGKGQGLPRIEVAAKRIGRTFELLRYIGDQKDDEQQDAQREVLRRVKQIIRLTEEWERTAGRGLVVYHLARSVDGTERGPKGSK